MEITVQEASYSEKPVLRNLMELCQHDYSEFNGREVNEHGLFQYTYLDHYWTEPGRFPFLVRVDGKLAGLALVRIVGEENGEVIYSMAEFFILRKYRLKGIGRQVALRLFQRFPGRWRVSQEAGNLPAQAFWIKVISDYTHGNFQENPDGPIQEFRSN